MFSAKVILDSLNPYNGIRLITMELTYPRFIHAEFMTHRMFSRNTASSRAIPVEKTIQMVLDNPAMPVFWGKKQKGMAAETEVDDKEEAKRQWLLGRDRAVETARAMLACGLHKQLTNRVLEPFLWHTAVVTATEWSNFFALRDHKDAQPEIAHLARLMKVSQQESKPVSNYYHTPYIRAEDSKDIQNIAHQLSKRHLLDEDENIMYWDCLMRISAARCARVSYLTQNGIRDIEEDLNLFDRLTKGSGVGHWSPMEHVAEASNESIPIKVGSEWKIVPVWSGNFRGWKQFRKTFVGECQ